MKSAEKWTRCLQPNRSSRRDAVSDLTNANEHESNRGNRRRRAAHRAAGKTHVAGIHRLFLDHFDADERAVLGELLGRLTDGEDGGACAPE